MGKYRQKEKAGAGERLIRRIKARKPVPTLDLPDMELATPPTPHRLVAGKWVPINTATKPTTKAERRKIYEKNRRTHKKVNNDPGYVIDLLNRVAKLEHNQANHIDAVAAKLDQLEHQLVYRMVDIEVSTHKLEQAFAGVDKRLWAFGADQTAQRDRINALEQGLDAVREDMAAGKQQMDALQARVDAIGVELDLNNPITPERHVKVIPKHTIPNAAATMIYEVEQQMETVKAMLKALRESKG